MKTDFSDNILVQKCISFSLSVIAFVKTLEEQKKFVIAKQMLRRATSVGACVMEAQSAESKADFIHKLKIADKECLETWYWLILCKQSADYPCDEMLFGILEEIRKLLNAILKSARQNMSIQKL